MPRDVHPRSEKPHAFATQLGAVPSECRESIRADDPMTRHGGIVAGPHDVADGTRGERATRDHPDEAVRRDAPGRYPLHHRVDRALPGVGGCAFHARHTAAGGHSHALDAPFASPAGGAGVIKALVFDFDGLILETETPAFETWAELYREHGHELPRDRWVQNIGASAWPFDALEHLASLVAQAGPFDREAIRARRSARQVELVAALETMDGVRDYLRDARRLGLKVAVASSGSDAYVTGHLERLGLRAGLDAVVCRDHVARGKPFPDLYLRAVGDLGVAAREAIAFEDSPNGIAAAKAAGLRCVAVPNPITSELDVSAADLRLDTLGALGLEQLIARFR
jgi:HAD superfamily hydrolase (TIGR01509 family)